MKKLYWSLVSLFCTIGFTACEGGPFFEPSDREDDLSYLYVKSRKYNVVYYGYGSDVSTEQTGSRVFAYEENRIIGEIYDYALVQYNKGDILSTQSNHEEVEYSWNGRVCTQKWESGDIVTEYLDDTYIRVKTLETDNYKLVNEYDGKKIIKESSYVGDNLEYVREYNYNGLTATYTQTNYTDTNSDLNGILMQRVGGKIIYQDNTYLRVLYQEYECHSNVGDVYKEMTTNTFDGVKLVKSEVRLKGSYNGYAYEDNALFMRSEYEWEGSKCKVKTTQYHQDPQPPYNEHNGKVAAITDTEFEYLDFEPAK